MQLNDSASRLNSLRATSNPPAESRPEELTSVLIRLNAVEIRLERLDERERDER
jgi:hypothetical protein